ncbi:hypothetical protein KM043_002411 [Ampulex compressa]|nr:hypothetical protein KM043_002411 [Ampulex compressa]
MVLLIARRVSPQQKVLWTTLKAYTLLATPIPFEQKSSTFIQKVSKGQVEGRNVKFQRHVERTDEMDSFVATKDDFTCASKRVRNLDRYLDICVILIRIEMPSIAGPE